MNESSIYEYLAAHSITYKKYEHAAVFTAAEAELIPDMPGVGTKNLFLRDKSGNRHFLVCVEHTKRVDLRELATLIDCSKLSFASAERLQRYLHVAPGSVTILALVHPEAKDVELILDDDIAAAAAIQCHPLVNTATIILEKEMVEKFLSATGHSPCFLPL